LTEARRLTVVDVYVMPNAKVIFTWTVVIVMGSERIFFFVWGGLLCFDSIFSIYQKLIVNCAHKLLI